MAEALRSIFSVSSDEVLETALKSFYELWPEYQDQHVVVKAESTVYLGFKVDEAVRAFTEALLYFKSLPRRPKWPWGISVVKEFAVRAWATELIDQQFAAEST